jgi:hypothetical protein
MKDSTATSEYFGRLISGADLERSELAFFELTFCFAVTVRLWLEFAILGG